MTPARLVSSREVSRSIDVLTFGAARRGPEDGPPGPAKPFAFKRIVAAVDGTPASEHVAAWARDLAQAFDARVWVVHAVLPQNVFEDYTEWSSSTATGAALFRREYRSGEAAVRAALAVLRKAGVAAEGTVLVGHVTPEVSKFVETKRADLLVVGSHNRRRLGRWMLGSVADALKNHVPASVLIARSPPRHGRILVAADGSSPSQRAAGIGLRLARRWDGHATVLHVLYPPVLANGTETKQRLQAALRRLPLPRGDRHLSFALDQGVPAARIVRRARDKAADLVVMGSRGLSGLLSLIVGSVGNRVAHDSPVAVLLVKELKEKWVSPQPPPRSSSRPPSPSPVAQLPL